MLSRADSCPTRKMKMLVDVCQQTNVASTFLIG